MARRHVTLVLDLDAEGNPIEINRGWQEDEVTLPTGGLGMTPRFNVDEASLAAVLPDAAAQVAQIAKLNTDLAAAVTARAEAVTAKIAAEGERDAKVAAAERARDEAIAAAVADATSKIAEAKGAEAAANSARVVAEGLVAERDATIETLNARIAELTAPPTAITISDRQFFQALAMGGMISEEEAEAAVATGTIPADMAALVEQLPADQRFNARMLLKGATTFRSDHPLSDMLAQLYEWTAEQKLDLFRVASQL